MHKFGYLIIPILFCVGAPMQEGGRLRIQDRELDARVENFLERHESSWRDMNISMRDGRILHDIVLENSYGRALEIGTSTGHSTIWIAWALSKTGGKLITIEIDERRHRQALASIEEAGLSAFVNARLGDAHELVPALEETFDFVFCDADKGWYKNYLRAVLPKLDSGGCFAAHNVRGRRGRGIWGIGEYVTYLESLPFMETTYVSSSWAGIAVSYNRRKKQ